MMTQRLSPEKWLDAGFTALVSLGPAALAADPLARSLGTTKGSFYWHFKDVPAYHTALIRQWQARALDEVIEQLEGTEPPDARLRTFGHGILNAPTEAALRVWAQNNIDVAAAMAEVDTARLAFLQHLLARFGLRNPAFGAAILACLIGLPQIQSTTEKAAAFDALVDTVVSLA